MEIVVLNLTPEGVTPNTHASQFDDGRVIRFMLKDGASAYTLAGTETITAKITRSDLTQTTLAVTNTSDNYIDLVTDADTCPVPGVYACEMEIVDGGVVIGSQNFALLVQRDPYNGKNIRTITVGPADICTFTTTLAEPFQSVLVNVLATGGNGTPDNPNPINGYTEANITRCGVNLFDKTNIADGYIDDTTGAVSGGAYYKHTDYIPVVGGQKIYIMTEQTTARWGAWYDKDKNYISGITNYSQTEATAPNNACFIRLTCKTDDTGNLDTFAVNYPSTPTFTHYNGDTVTIAFGQTVYGGVLDVTGGKLHVTHAEVDLGTLDYSEGFSGFYTTGIASIVKVPDIVTTEVCLCEGYPFDIAADKSYFMQIIDVYKGWLIFRNSDYNTTTAFKNSVNGMKFVYPLATPFDIDLTPEVISAIVGTNNVFADCGESTVKYLAEG